MATPTTTAAALDAAALAHLDRWLAANLDQDEAWLVRPAMIALAESDPDWLDRGWWKTYDEAKCY